MANGGRDGTVRSVFEGRGRRNLRLSHRGPPPGRSSTARLAPVTRLGVGGAAQRALPVGRHAHTPSSWRQPGTSARASAGSGTRISAAHLSPRASQVGSALERATRACGELLVAATCGILCGKLRRPAATILLLSRSRSSLSHRHPMSRTILSVLHREGPPGARSCRVVLSVALQPEIVCACAADGAVRVGHLRLDNPRRTATCHACGRGDDPQSLSPTVTGIAPRVFRAWPKKN